MVVSKFSENFWGDKLNGFDILCQNLKHSLNNVKELETYFRECSNIEGEYTKLITKLTLQTNKYSTNGTFYPLWSPIKELNEKLNTKHMQQMQQINEYIKEIQRYYEDFNKKTKKLRDNESQTQQCVQNFQDITQALMKSKEQYHTVAIEYEKQKRADNQNIQKLERKLKLSLDDYKLNIEKYNIIRNDYERKVNDSCHNFQLSEEVHLKQMRSFIDNYGKMLINNNQIITQIYQEFYAKIDSLNNDYLMQMFIDNKRTGSDRPEAVCLIEPDFSKLPQQIQNNNNEIDLTFNLNDSQTNSSNYQSLNTIHSGSNINPLSLSSSTSSSNNETQLNTSPLNNNSNNQNQLTSTSSSTTTSNSSTSNTTTMSSTTSTTSTSLLNMKRSDSKGFNIFNVDILNRKSKASKTAKANANAKLKKKASLDQTTQQQQQQQYHKQITPDHSFIQAPQLDLIQINYDSNLNSKDDFLYIDNQNQNDNLTSNSVSSMLGSSSLDLFDTLKNSTNGSDIDSEGYSIRPDKIKKSNLNKDTDDLNNFYNSSSASNSDSDSEGEPGTGPTKVMLTIKPKEECETNLNESNTDLLREIGKNLQLKSLQSLNSQAQLQSQQQQQQQQATKVSKRSYCSFGTNELQSNWSNLSSSASPTNIAMSRSISFGGVTTTTNTISPTTTIDLNSSVRTPVNGGANESILYNIDEDKEVESSFQVNGHNKRNSSSVSSTTPVSQTNITPVPQTQGSIQLPSVPPPLPPPPPSFSNVNSLAGRFTPACFPGRTTPDFHYTTSFFENSTRAITSPLTLNDNTIIPVAVAFNETIHAYFKLAEHTKHKIKCVGCMKVSFPMAILKFVAMNDLPQFEFRLKNLQLNSQDDLILNKQLLNNTANTVNQYHFNTLNLVKELKEQHGVNQHAAFFNFELLKYEYKFTDEPPLLLNSKWSYKKLSETQIELNFNLDFTYNYKKSHLSNVNFMLSITQQLKKFKLSVNLTEPQAQVQINDDKLQVLWQFLNLSKSNSLNVKLFMNIIDLSDSKLSDLINYVCEQPLYVKFFIDNQTLSNIKLEILSNNYKLSLLKEKIESGKYFCTPFLVDNHENEENNDLKTTLIDSVSVFSGADALLNI